MVAGTRPAVDALLLRRSVPRRVSKFCKYRTSLSTQPLNTASKQLLSEGNRPPECDPWKPITHKRFLLLLVSRQLVLRNRIIQTIGGVSERNSEYPFKNITY